MGSIAGLDAASSAQSAQLQSIQSSLNSEVSRALASETSIVDSLTSSIIALQGSATQCTVSGLCTTTSNQAASIASIMNTLTSIQATVTQTAQAVTAIQSTIAIMQTNLSTHTSQISSLNTQATSLQSQINTHTNSIGSLNTLTTVLNVNLSVVTAKQLTDEGSITTLTNNLATLSSTVGTQGTAISGLTTDVNSVYNCSVSGYAASRAARSGGNSAGCVTVPVPALPVSSCQATMVGLLTYNTTQNTLFMCNGSQFLSVTQVPLGSTQLNPAVSCQVILTSGSGRANLAYSSYPLSLYHRHGVCAVLDRHGRKCGY